VPVYSGPVWDRGRKRGTDRTRQGSRVRAGAVYSSLLPEREFVCVASCVRVHARTSHL